MRKGRRTVQLPRELQRRCRSRHAVILELRMQASGLGWAWSYAGRSREVRERVACGGSDRWRLLSFCRSYRGR